MERIRKESHLPKKKNSCGHWASNKDIRTPSLRKDLQLYILLSFDPVRALEIRDVAPACLKVLANEDILFGTHCCSWCFLGCANWETFVADTKCFWTKSETFFVSRTQNLCPQQMLRARANGETFVSATMCPQQCVLVCQGLKTTRETNEQSKWADWMWCTWGACAVCARARAMAHCKNVWWRLKVTMLPVALCVLMWSTKRELPRSWSLSWRWATLQYLKRSQRVF